MSETRMKIRFFTIADFKEEEIWLREEHQNGWKLTKNIPPCFYYFEKCEPEDVIYRLDYKNNSENPEYMQMMNDYGWEYAGKCVGWLYFRKPASAVENENDGELLSDNESRCNMLQHIIQTRMLPLLAIFLCCVIPGFSRVIENGASTFLSVFEAILLLIYIYLLVHCGRKLKKMKAELSEL